VTPNWVNRRFNERYSGGETVFGEPDALLTAAPVLLAALCTGKDPSDDAESIGARGASSLKSLVIEAVNERLRPHRRRPADLIADPAYRTDVLAQGNARANQVADETFRHLRQVMGMTYQPDRGRIPLADGPRSRSGQPKPIRRRLLEGREATQKW